MYISPLPLPSRMNFLCKAHCTCNHTQRDTFSPIPPTSSLQLLFILSRRPCAIPINPPHAFNFPPTDNPVLCRILVLLLFPRFHLVHCESSPKSKNSKPCLVAINYYTKKEPPLFCSRCRNSIVSGQYSSDLLFLSKS